MERNCRAAFFRFNGNGKTIYILKNLSLWAGHSISKWIFAHFENALHMCVNVYELNENGRDNHGENVYWKSTNCVNMMEKRKISRIICILTQWNGFGIVETEPNVFICLKLVIKVNSLTIIVDGQRKGLLKQMPWTVYFSEYFILGPYSSVSARTHTYTDRMNRINRFACQKLM